MLNAVRRIKGAVAQKDILPGLTRFMVHEGTIRAADGRIVAGTPFPDPRTFTLPAEEFSKVLENLGPSIQPKIEITDANIIVKHSRMRVKFGLEEPDIGLYAEPKDYDPTPVTAEFTAALRRVRPFVSDNATRPWAMCIYVKDADMYATNNVSVARTQGPKTGFDVLIPSYVVDFILAQDGEIDHVGHLDKTIIVRWKDGTWLKSTTFNNEFPEAAVSIFDNLSAPTWELTAAWKEAYKRVAAFTESDLYLYADRIAGGQEKVQVEDGIETPVPEGQDCSAWGVQFLNTVVDAATHWAPDLYPAPTPFRGPGIEGCIIGRTK